MGRRIAAVLVLAAASAVFAAPAFADGDAAAGKVVFNKCSLCHSNQKGVNKIGPSLYDVYGRHSASLDNYSYSAALKALNVTWDDDTLNKWITNPRAMAPGTKMIFAGLPNEADRQNVIAYLKTLK